MSPSGRYRLLYWLEGAGFVKQISFLFHGFYSVSLLLTRASRECLVASPVSAELPSGLI